ncbi:hypothetical protein L0V05_00655 [Tabrizicola sp. J26]|uniref:hypothetical protein n=1 Tax=Alitabrizicola rongguiensis TaxID=2909234 RepID=UPI001F1B0BE8|nr:hypothetical protein [Tabrizicola rongguiensis]MCF1707315.1 hypothetical protein [Tabrizicola rongguiensis]
MRPSSPERRSFLIWGAVLALSGPALAQSVERIRFGKGADNASVQGAVKGGSYRDYLLSARADQTMNVALVTEGSAYFNIMPPGATYEAIYNASIDGNSAVGVRLPRSGDYRIRVYLMGADDSDRKTIPFTLSVTIT